MRVRRRPQSPPVCPKSKKSARNHQGTTSTEACDETVSIPLLVASLTTLKRKIRYSEVPLAALRPLLEKLASRQSSTRVLSSEKHETPARRYQCPQEPVLIVHYYPESCERTIPRRFLFAASSSPM